MRRASTPRAGEPAPERSRARRPARRYRVDGFSRGGGLPATAARTPLRTGMSVPMFVGRRPDRRPLARQSAGRPLHQRRRARRRRSSPARSRVAVQNARLHAFIRAASRSGKQPSTPSAIRSRCSTARGRLLRGNTALAAYLDRSGHRASRLQLRRRRLLRRPVAGCAVGHAASHDAARTRSDAAGRPDLQRHHVSGLDAARRRGRSSRSPRTSPTNPQRAPAAPDERRAAAPTPPRRDASSA